MARDKISRTTRLKAATRLQDLSGLDARILELVSEELLPPLAERISDLETTVAALVRNAIYEVDVVLLHGGRSGWFRVEPVVGFADETIGRPVIVQPFITEADAVFFSARVLNAREMLVQWHSMEPAPPRAKLVYLIG